MVESSDVQLLTALRTAAHAVTANRNVRDLDATLGQLVQSAVDTVTGADGGGITRTRPGQVSASHATDDDIAVLDQLQARLEEGPCVTAADDPPTGGTGLVLAHDLAGADAGRWPRFGAAAVDAGYRSLLSVPLSLSYTSRSALNLYARRPDVFDAPARLSAGLFGLQAAVALHGADHAAQLSLALASRDVIGQAKGILMERFSVDDDEAFRMLVSSSQDTNIKLVEVARWLTHDVATREAPVATPLRTPGWER